MKLTYEGGLNFSVPTTAGVVSHFILQVLAETNTVSLGTQPYQEKVSSSHEIGQSLIVDDTLTTVRKSIKRLPFQLPRRRLRDGAAYHQAGSLGHRGEVQHP